ncbi:ribosome-recycling factor, chloroplastic isoform X1 [Daucus carota subsp. sativus]|uniref:ribosome-recycling factor, chloroplastic isoform X1 n=1 Tax=Daucus carota subsp. sativus TaxID=79200 RepID=UPI0007F021CE|nr:PREDICTED: ribosome-recycling factor, chloroplastic-like isoform X1 [Daucus carota subsp. sativus]
MALSVSSSTAAIYQAAYLKPSPPKIQQSLRPKGPNCVKCNLTSGCVKSWAASANYVKLQMGCGEFAERSMAVGRLSQKRQVNCLGNVKCATLEDIEAEKSLIEKNVKERMEKTIETVRANFGSIRTGRSNPAMLDKIEVEYYGTSTSLKSIAQISTPDSSSLLVNPYDKSSLKAIEKAIVNSDLGITPSNDGNVIRLSIPQLTADRRKELTKMVAKQAEEGKVALRNIRRDAIKSYDKLEKEKKLSEDIVKDLASDLQRVTDEYIKKVDSIFKQKEKELMTV